MEKLEIKDVYIAGGSKAVATELEQDLPKLVRRFAGANRYETAALIASYMGTKDRTVFLASGENFPDALVIGPIAAKTQNPILLTKKSSLPQATKDYIAMNDISNVLILGGPKAVSAGVVNQIPVR